MTWEERFEQDLRRMEESANLHEREFGPAGVLAYKVGWLQGALRHAYKQNDMLREAMAMLVTNAAKEIS